VNPEASDPAVSAPVPVRFGYEPEIRPAGNVPEVIFDATVVSVVADAASPETAADVIAIPVFVTLVTCPCALVTKTGTLEDVPYVPAVPTLEILNVVDGLRFSPVPARYGTAELIRVNVMLVTPKTMTPITLHTYVSPAPVSPAVI